MAKKEQAAQTHKSRTISSSCGLPLQICSFTLLGRDTCKSPVLLVGLGAGVGGHNGGGNNQSNKGQGNQKIVHRKNLLAGLS